MKTVEQLTDSAGCQLQIPNPRATVFRHNLNRLILEVEVLLRDVPELATLIGPNSPQHVFSNIHYHGRFMSMVLEFGDKQLLIRNLLWLYQTCRAHKFSDDYLHAEVQAWIKALEKYLDHECDESIVRVFRWAEQHHDHFVQLSLSQGSDCFTMSGEGKWKNLKDRFLTAVLDGNHRACLNIASISIESSDDLAEFYENVLRPVLYDIGELWQNGEISVALEHLATAIIGRVMASVNVMYEAPTCREKKAVIAAVNGEQHELGAMMVSDVIECAGWRVKYLGANVPQADLVEVLLDFRPDLLALSVALPCNIGHAMTLISTIRGMNELASVKIAVGGYGLLTNPELCRTRLNADFLVRDLFELNTILQDCS